MTLTLPLPSPDNGRKSATDVVRDRGLTATVALLGAPSAR